MKASVEHIREKFAFTERRACRLLLVPVSSYRYRPSRNDDGLRDRLIALAREKPRFGYRRLHVLLGREGEVVNHKRVHRIYREAGLALRRKKRKHCVRAGIPLGVYTAANQEWALDFVHDVAAGRTIRVLNVVDAFTRESLAMEVDTSFAGLRVTRVLDQIIRERGLPRAIRCDNGPEFAAKDLRKWLAATGSKTLYIEPGSPWENGYCESFNSKMRDEFLNGEIFYSLKEVRVLAERWRVYFNTERPHSSLGYRPPAPAAWQTEASQGHGKVESKQRFPLSHTPYCGGIDSPPVALH